MDVVRRCGGRGRSCSKASRVDRGSVDRVHIGVAVVKAIMTLEGERHGCETVVTAEVEGPGDLVVFKSELLPFIEDIAGGKDCGRGDNGFNQVGAVVARLKVGRAIVGRQREEAPFSKAVIGGRRDAVQRHRDTDRVDVDSVEEEAKIAGDTHVGTAIYESRLCSNTRACIVT
jgi:hypothetical protein